MRTRLQEIGRDDRVVGSGAHALLGEPTGGRDLASRQLEARAEIVEVDLGMDRDVARHVRLPDLRPLIDVRHRERQLEADVVLDAGVDLVGAVRREDDEAAVALELREERRELRVAFADKRLAAIEDEHRALDAGLGIEIGDEQDKATRIAGQRRAIDHDERAPELEGERLGEHRLAGTRRADDRDGEAVGADEGARVRRVRAQLRTARRVREVAQDLAQLVHVLREQRDLVEPDDGVLQIGERAQRGVDAATAEDEVGEPLRDLDFLGERAVALGFLGALERRQLVLDELRIGREVPPRLKALDAAAEEELERQIDVDEVEQDVVVEAREAATERQIEQRHQRQLEHLALDVVEVVGLRHVVQREGPAVLGGLAAQARHLHVGLERALADIVDRLVGILRREASVAQMDGVLEQHFPAAQDAVHEARVELDEVRIGIKHRGASKGHSLAARAGTCQRAAFMVKGGRPCAFFDEPAQGPERTVTPGHEDCGD